MFQLHNWRSISRTAKGDEPGPVGSINKLWWSEMSKRLHDTAMAVLGPARRSGAAPTTTPATARGSGRGSTTRPARSGPGTNEIQRNVIGERVLGLPREPR